MPRIAIVAADVPAGRLRRMVERCAEDAGLRVEEPATDRADLRLRAGDLTASIFLGAFILYVDAAVTVERLDRGEAEIVVEWDSPWWTGLIGCGRTRSALTGLANRLEDGIEDAGGDVVERVG